MKLVSVIDDRLEQRRLGSRNGVLMGYTLVLTGHKLALVMGGF